MKTEKRLVAAVIVSLQILPLFTIIHGFAEDSTESMVENTPSELALEYLKNTQSENDSWVMNNWDYTADIADILEYVYDYSLGMFEDILDNMIVKSANHIWYNGIQNVDKLSHYLYLTELQSHNEISLLLSKQNPDGGFGVDKGYTSDIIDTKLALKALADLGETEAMAADIFGDCIIKDQSLAHTLSDTLDKLDGYLDDNMPALEDLSENNLSEVYQHFHTALFKMVINNGRNNE